MAHLTLEQRYKIEAYRNAGSRISEIFQADDTLQQAKDIFHYRYHPAHKTKVLNQWLSENKEK